MTRFSIPKSVLLDKARQCATPVVVVLVGVGAFGLGRLSAIEEAKGALKIYAPAALEGGQSATVAASAVGGLAVDEQARMLATPTPASSEQLSAAASTTADVAHNFVASKNGTKYYPAGCSGVSRIKVANRVWFASAVDAQAAGYTLASGCK